MHRRWLNPTPFARGDNLILRGSHLRLQKNVSTDSTTRVPPVVISGISGRFPMAANVEEFKNNLFISKDMTAENRRWKNCERVPSRMGLLDCMHEFDANFFNLTPKQANQLDPQIRILLEVIFEAMIDAGLNPTEMRGSRTGVYCAALGNEAVDHGFARFDPELQGYMGLCFYNYGIPAHIAFTFDFRGTSTHISSACSSSFTALEAALSSIILGKCDAAVVTGSNICLNPRSNSDLMTLNVLAKDGHCKVFDESADGYARSEAIAAIVIQKETDAKRKYGTILSVQSNTDGFKHEGIFSPNGLVQEVVFRETCASAGIDPSEVTYMEAHGTGTPTGDPQEVGAIYRVYCENRDKDKPLLLGSVKSNMGHSESTAGLSSLAKAIISIQTGFIPPNMHFNKLNPKLEPMFQDGSLQIVSKKAPFDGGLMAINCFGIGGTNTHLILQPGERSSESSPARGENLPVLLPFSGRTEEQVKASLTEAASNARNTEFAYLIRSAFKKTIPGHGYRGCGLLKQGESEISVMIQKSQKRPLWIVFPGMGSQYAEMGKDLLQIDVFAESMHRSRETLKSVNIDLDQILEPRNDSIYKNIHHAMMAITAVQMALWDTFSALKAHADGYIGHSNGEYLCAYADGCLSAEETLLMAHARGRAFIDGKMTEGAMASVGAAAEDIKPRLPDGVELACDNAPNNVTISGRESSVKSFVEQLKKEGKFAAIVNSCGIAAHGSFIVKSAELFLQYSGNIITDERPRSSKWLSTCLPKGEWNSTVGKNASPEYFAHNLRAPVQFRNALQQIPQDSIVIELSPKGFFQAIIKESVPNNCVLLAPMSFKATDKLAHFFESVGQAFTAGVDIQMDKLYPQVQTPVSAQTPSIAHLVKWDHQDSYKTHILEYPLDSGIETTVNIQLPSHSFLSGHMLEGRIIYPATGYIHLAWTNFADHLGLKMDAAPFIITNLALHRATILNELKPSILFSTLLSRSGKFEIINEGDIVVSGVIKAATPNTRQKAGQRSAGDLKGTGLNKDDIYKELRLRGYNYSGLFQGIREMDEQGFEADVSWMGNWVSFLDTLLQTSLVACSKTRDLLLPTEIDEIVIDPKYFLQNVPQVLEKQHPNIRVTIDHHMNTISCPGIEIKGLTTKAVRRREQKANLAYEKYTFCPFLDEAPGVRQTQMWELLDLVLENNPGTAIEVSDVFLKKENSVAKTIQEIIAMKPLRQAFVQMATIESEASQMKEEDRVAPLTTSEARDGLAPASPADLIVLDDASLATSMVSSLKVGGFLLVNDTASQEIQEVLEPAGLKMVSLKCTVGGRTNALFRKVDPSADTFVHVPLVDEKGLTWLPQLQDALKKNRKVYITSQGNSTSGILGLINCLRKESGGGNVRCIFDPQAKLHLDFDSPDPLLRSILATDLVVNVFHGGQLGSYRHLPLNKETVSKDAKPVYASTTVPGDLSSLQWIESPLSKNPAAAHKVRYDVAYAALNFRDVLLATNTIPVQEMDPGSYRNSFLGFEFSGFEHNGDKRVMGIVAGGGLATSVLASPNSVWEVPESWTLEGAATVPLVYGTAVLALQMRGHIQRGQKVLIHSGSGGVGLAAISLALARGCEVFTTVGSPEKRNFIKKTFPQIDDSHIGNSRDITFESQFMEATNGKGVDVVLNSLAGDKLKASVRCLAQHGKFLEIGVYDAYQNTALGMRPFLKGIEFHGIHLLQALQGGWVQYRFNSLMAEGIANGTIQPLSQTRVFESHELEQAFRFMATGNHVGKLLVRIRGEKQQDSPVSFPALRQTYFAAEKSYIIIGGLGGLGFEVAGWMIERGARNIILISRSGPSNGYQTLWLRRWREMGVTVSTPTIDLSNYEEAELFLREATSTQKVGGIINSALVLRDDSFSSQTPQMFQEVLGPKATVTENMDKLSRKYCKELDHFIVFSSIACGRGNADQSNYGLANSIMERICENRRTDGLPGLGIQWGVVGQVGVVAEKLFKNMSPADVLIGTAPQDVESCLSVLDSAIQQSSPIISSMVVAPKGVKLQKEMGQGLVQKMGKIFGIKDMDGVDPSRKLSEIGMDSLVSFELRQTLEREFDLPLTKEALWALTVGDLKAIDSGKFAVNGSLDDNGENTGPPVKSFVIHEKPLSKLTSSPDGSDRNIFMVHGMSGSAFPFVALGGKLKANVYALQFCERRMDSITVQGLASSYLEELRGVQQDGPYYLAGYSGGATIAYEMALLLQESGQKTKLIFLDGCPCWRIETHTLTNKYERKHMALVLLETMGLLQHVGKKETEELLRKCSGDVDQDSKVVEDLLSALQGMTIEVGNIHAYLTLLAASVDYLPTKTFSGDAILLEATEKAMLIPNDDYNLSTNIRGTISRHRIEGTHYSFLEGENNVQKMAEVVNLFVQDE